MNDLDLQRQRAAYAALTARAVSAATAIATAHGVRVDDPEVLAQGYAVRVHLRPAPVVARVSTITAVLRAPIEPWLARELDVAAFLAARGAPVVPPSDVLPPGPHHHDGLCVSFWRYVQPASDAVPDAPVAGRMLAELHAALRDYPGEMPVLAPPLNDIPRGLDRLERAGDILPAEDVALLRATCEPLLAQLDPRAFGPLQPIHGDAHVYNLIPVADGWLWNDLEDTCLGPVAWDLASLDGDGDGAALAAYPGAPAPESLDLLRQVRKLHGLVWVYALLPEFPDWAEQIAPLLDELRRSQ